MPMSQGDRGFTQLARVERKIGQTPLDMTRGLVTIVRLSFQLFDEIGGVL